MKGETSDIEKFGTENAARRSGLWINVTRKTMERFKVWLNYVKKKPSTLNMNK
jgi:hypothetical protein